MEIGRKSKIEGLAAVIQSSLQELERVQCRAAFDTCQGLKAISIALDGAREILADNVAFGAWCKNNFGWSRQHTLRVREAGRVAAALLEVKGNDKAAKNNLPATERQLRELAKVSDDKEQLQEMWTEISPDLPLNSNGQIKSAGAIKNALVEHKYIDPPVKKETTPAKAKRHARVVPADLFAGWTKEEMFNFLAEATEYVESI